MSKSKTKPKPLAVETVPIDSIHVDPANVRRHPERNLATIRASLARFGQQKPIVVDSDGIVRAGNGTLEAARALGWETIAIVRSPLAGSEATAYAIADNRSAELAEWDQAALAEQLQALQSEDFDLSAVGFEAAEVEAMLERMAGEIGSTPASLDDVPEKYEIIVECKDESHQRFLYDSLKEQGLTCRVLTL